MSGDGFRRGTGRGGARRGNGGSNRGGARGGGGGWRGGGGGWRGGWRGGGWRGRPWKGGSTGFRVLRGATGTQEGPGNSQRGKNKKNPK